MVIRRVKIRVVPDAARQMHRALAHRHTAQLQNLLLLIERSLQRQSHFTHVLLTQRHKSVQRRLLPESWRLKTLHQISTEKTLFFKGPKVNRIVT